MRVKGGSLGSVKLKKTTESKLDASILQLNSKRDLLTTTTTIVIGGKRKSVRKRIDYPRSILAFEKVFDDLLESEKCFFLIN